MTSKIRKILFATDLSMSARYAFKYAADIAAHHGAKIVVMHVIENIPDKAGVNMGDLIGEKEWKKLKEEQEQDVRDILIGKKTERRLIVQALEKFCIKMQNESTGDNEQVEVAVKYGNTAEVIIEQLESSDMLVMAYHYHNALAETIIGGITKKVLKYSKKPVLLVPMVNGE